MAKHKLTKNQNRRINKKQQDITLNNNNLFHGLVVAHYGDQVDIENTSDNISNNIIRSNLRQNLPPIAVGDKVIYQILNTADGTNQMAVISKLIKRRSLLSRYSTNKTTVKPIAANIDQMFIVFAPNPEPISFLIDQFLITSSSCNIKPILVFNKYDLYEKYQKTSNHLKLDLIDNLINIYSNIGYLILKVYKDNHESIQQIIDLMTNKTSILIGQSGVGKSSIAQKILVDNTIKIGEISLGSEHGKHTTSVAKLYHLPNNGELIDAPGIREIGVAYLSKTELEQAYPEFKPYLNKCKFNDCKHDQEPKCALKDAVEAGTISQTRWQNYKKFCLACEQYQRAN